MKLKIELSKNRIVNALGKGYREIELSKGNGGFGRRKQVVKSKKTYNRKKSQPKKDGWDFVILGKFIYLCCALGTLQHQLTIKQAKK